MNRPVVLLHGFTGSAASWGDHLLSALRQAEYAPLPIDLPGHGEEAIRYQEATLDAALGFVDTVLQGRSGAVLGYSMGGRIALHYAARFPERTGRLVLESSSPGLKTEAERASRRAADEAIAARLFSDGIEPFVTFWENQPIFESQKQMDPALRSALRRRRMRNDPGGLGSALRGLGTGELPSLWDTLPEIEVPVLILTGERDTKFTEIGAEMAAALPLARLKVVPDVGHAVHLEAPGPWRDAVGSFLRED